MNPPPREGVRPAPISDDELRRLPKILLHDHLDGSLRVATLLELCRRQGRPPPRESVAALTDWFRRNAMAGSLERYLEGFALTVGVMADLEAIERVAFEAAEDARAEGCVLAEFRMAPLLLEEHGLDADAIVDAMRRGLARSALPCGLILCGMRHHPPEAVRRTAELALRHRFSPERPGGVIGFDLAGPEWGHPATVHRDAIERVRRDGLPVTLHAGEADAAERVLEAVDLGAQRIGHGVRLADLLGSAQGDAAVKRLHDQGVHLEICPTSNVQTGAARSIAEHPIRALWDAGVSLSFHTDNHLMSCTDMIQEAGVLNREAGFAWDELLRMQHLALEASFMPAAAKDTARRALAHTPGA